MTNIDELYQKLEDFFNEKHFYTSLVYEGKNCIGYRLHQGVGRIDLKAIGFLENIRRYSDGLSTFEKFSAQLSSALASWSDELLMALCEKSKNKEFNDIVRKSDHFKRYLYHPSTLAKITEKNLDRYVRMIPDEDLLKGFVLRLKKENIVPQSFIKETLQARKKIRTLHYLIDGADKEKIETTDYHKNTAVLQKDFYPVEKSIFLSFEINYYLMPLSRKAEELKLAPFSPASINTYFMQMISDFESVKPDDSLGIHANKHFSKEGIKRFHVFAHDRENAQALAEVFIDCLKNNLRQNSSLGKYTTTNITKPSIEDMLSKVKYFALKNSLDSSLETKPTLSVKKL